MVFRVILFLWIIKKVSENILTPTKETASKTTTPTIPYLTAAFQHIHYYCSVKWNTLAKPKTKQKKIKMKSTSFVFMCVWIGLNCVRKFTPTFNIFIKCWCDIPWQYQYNRVIGCLKSILRSKKRCDR